MSLSLSDEQKRHLRKLGHELKPVVLIGSNGLTESVLAEIDSSITHHELIKVKIKAGDRELRDGMINDICEHQDAILVQRIGNIALLFRRNTKKPKIFFS